MCSLLTGVILDGLAVRKVVFDVCVGMFCFMVVSQYRLYPNSLSDPFLSIQTKACIANTLSILYLHVHSTLSYAYSYLSLFPLKQNY